MPPAGIFGAGLRIPGRATSAPPYRLICKFTNFLAIPKQKKIPVERGVNPSPPAKRAPPPDGARFHCKIFSRLLLIFPVTPSFSPGALLHFLTLSNFISPRSAPSFSPAASLRINPFTYAFPLIAYSSPNCAANVGIIFT